MYNVRGRLGALGSFFLMEIGVWDDRLPERRGGVRGGMDGHGYAYS